MVKNDDISLYNQIINLNTLKTAQFSKNAYLITNWLIYYIINMISTQ